MSVLLQTPCQKCLIDRPVLQTHPGEAAGALHRPCGQHVQTGGAERVAIGRALRPGQAHQGRAASGTYCKRLEGLGRFDENAPAWVSSGATSLF